MNSDFPAADTNNAMDAINARAALPPERRRFPAAGIIILLAFLGGIAVALWATPRVESWWAGDDGQQPASDAGGAVNVADLEQSSAATSTTPANVAALEARLASVSAQLDTIAEQAAGAGGNAARAEGLLIAFAVRRALDRGSSLGYLEGELRLRFGSAQPKAVATIINAAAQPVTIADLQQGLDDVSPQLLGSPAKRDWWTATKEELAHLVIIRRAGEPSPVPQKAIDRAKLLMYAQRVDAAIKEIERLPDHEDADNWLQMARQYNEARRALDVIEAAAILEPRVIPAAPRGGAPTNMQVAPPPPVVPTVKPAAE